MSSGYYVNSSSPEAPRRTMISTGEDNILSSSQSQQIVAVNHDHSQMQTMQRPSNHVGYHEEIGTSTSAPSHDRLQQFRHKMANYCRLNSMKLLRECIAELVGTAVLVIYGCGVLAQVIIGDRGKNSHGDFMSISLGWGMAVMMGVFFSGGGGPGLINPAVTLAFAIIGKIRFQEILPYSISQLIGAFFGSLVVFSINYDGIMKYAEHGADGHFMMNHTGKIFVTMPGEGISNTACFLDQIFGTALLTASALAITDKNNWNMPGYLHPFMLGMMIFAIVGAFGLNAGAALNPARDLGPRFMIALCGWGSEAFTSDSYYFWIPIVGPYIGAVIGAVIYEVSIGIHLDNAAVAGSKDKVIVVSKGGMRKEKKEKNFVEELMPREENQQPLIKHNDSRI